MQKVKTMKKSPKHKGKNKKNVANNNEIQYNPINPVELRNLTVDLNLPTGNILSTTLKPHIKESLTFALKAILQPLFNNLVVVKSLINPISNKNTTTTNSSNYFIRRFSGA